jgi:solute carrier family 39 (zinc transporter), member 1/2/3
MSTAFNPQAVNLDTADHTQIICYLFASPNDYDGRLGARISSVFVILIISTVVTFFPVLAVRVKWLKIPLYVYLFARYFGAGVIIATAFIHLLDPAYAEIGPQTCVGMTGGWATYSWPPAIALTSVMLIFLLDFGAERYVEIKYGFAHSQVDAEDVVTNQPKTENQDNNRPERAPSHSHQHLHSGDQDDEIGRQTVQADSERYTDDKKFAKESDTEISQAAAEHAFREQIAGFLILEFGVIVHSVIIGLNLGVVGAEFSTLYPVLVFHQSFEGLGIGARLSAIPFPKRLHWMPWALCLAYGLTTPISIAIGLGVRTTYSSYGYTASVVSGVLDSISAGILVYTGLVELLARDFLFNPSRTNDNKRLTFMLVCLFLGTGIMALLGKWA